MGYVRFYQNASKVVMRIQENDLSAANLTQLLIEFLAIYPDAHTPSENVFLITLTWKSKRESPQAASDHHQRRTDFGISTDT